MDPLSLHPMPGRQQLAEDFRRCSDVLAALDAAGLPRALKRQEDAVTVCVLVDGKDAEISFNFLSPEAYPDSPVLIACENETALSSQLHEVSSFYEDRGALHEVLGHVCREIGAGEPLLRPALAVL